MMGFVTPPPLPPSPHSSSVPLFTPPPLPLQRDFLSFGFLRCVGLYQRRCCLTVSDTQLAGFQSIIKELSAAPSTPPLSSRPPPLLPTLLRMSSVQPWLMEKVTSSPPAGSAGREQDHSGGTKAPRRQRRPRLLDPRCPVKLS